MSEEYSYARLASECRIIIPSLQRAYAQGRDTQRATKIRNKFITDIKEALDENKKLSLETVYGELRDGVFTPLDGQQRLTTLFLLHLYLGRYAGIDVPFLTDEYGKSKFRYATRTSSEDFCEYLIKKDFRVDPAATGNIIPPRFDENSREREGITQRIIKSDMDFQWTWYNDPTIAAMLNMLDTIHAKFYQGPYKKYYDSLTDNAAPLVTFWYQEIEGAIPADELYVRMNARGLALTEFENYKASLLHFLGSENPTGNTIVNIDTIKENIDSKWQTEIWNYCGKGNIPIGTSKAVDTILLRILHMCILFELMKKYPSSGGEADDEAEKRKRTAAENAVAKFIETARFDQYELSQCDYYRDLDPGEKETLSGEIVRMMDLIMKAIENHQIRGTELEKLLDVNEQRQQDIYNRPYILRFYVRCYLVPAAGGNTEIYDVLERLINYTDTRKFPYFEKALKALYRLKEDAGGFLPGFRDAEDPEVFVRNGFAKNQTWEEHLKLKMKENPDWKTSIEAAEKDAFFDGQILFLFECLLDDDLAKVDAADKTRKLMMLVDRRDDPKFREKFDTYFEFCKDTFAKANANSNCLRKLLMLQAISENVGRNSLPVYPFTPEYAEKWNKDQTSSLNNPGSMILDGTDGGKLSWKRVLRIDLSNQKQDQPAYRKLIRTAVKAACEFPGDTVAEKLQPLVKEWQAYAIAERWRSLLWNGLSDRQDGIFRSVRDTLLEWCLQDDWSGYYKSGIRLSDHGQLYLLDGDGARLKKTYQELHMMLMKPRLVGKVCGWNFDDHDRGCLTLSRDNEQEVIQLEYYDGKVRGRRGPKEHMDDSWKYCDYAPDAVVNLINDLSVGRSDASQSPLDGGQEAAPDADASRPL